MHKLNEEIELEKIFKALYKGKFTIVISTILFSVFAVFYSLSLSNEYTSSSKLKISEGMDSGTNSFQQYSGIASIAGVSLPNKKSDSASVAIATILSRDFLEHLLEINDVRAKLAASKSFDKVTGKILYDLDIYDPIQKKWTRSKTYFSQSVIPSHLELYSIYRSILSVSQDKDTGLIDISVKHLSPNFANEFLSLIIYEINEISKKRDIEIANDSLDFIQKKIISTQLAEIKSTLNILLTEQLKKQMLVNVSKYYILEPIDSPFIPEMKSGPNRALICILFSLTGLILSMTFVLLTNFFKDKED
jgi:LPS O-antigen subunit length determinant protein (WzzB/FepE family)